jgi:biopolymer transport protein ExbD
MRFATRKRRQAPAIIIVSLIDILIVLLIFMMATTTFKNRPVLKLTLPESKQATKGTVDERLVITVNKVEPFFYFKTRPVTLEQLKQILRSEAVKSTRLPVAIYADEASTIGNALRASEAATTAGFVPSNVKLVIREAGGK